MNSTDTGAYNICINQGATLTLMFIWTTGQCCGAVGTTAMPVDLTGYTAALQIRAYALAPTILYDASSNLVLGGIAGTITLTIPASVTATFGWWQGVYDLLLISSSGVVTRLLAGTVTVSAQVTISNIIVVTVITNSSGGTITDSSGSAITSLP
jgi:hypothetical protein